MHSGETLTKKFEERLWRAPIGYAIEINDAGLVFGAGTVLAQMTRDWEGAQVLALDNSNEERILTLLSAVYGRAVSPDVFRHIEGASEQWRRGDKALANIRLAFARLPRLETRTDAYRLFVAEDLLDKGMSPRALMRELGFDRAARDLARYDPSQPRVPAGNGRQSGEWGDGGGTEAFVGAVATRAGAGSFVAAITPETLVALAAFASRFTVPTAVLGAIFIPSPNDGGVSQGTLPDQPDTSYRLDRPAGTLIITTKASDGTDIAIRAQNRDGIYVDVETGKPIGRDLRGDLFIEGDAVKDAIQTRKDENPQAGADAQADQNANEPKLCPAPLPRYAAWRERPRQRLRGRCPCTRQSARADTTRLCGHAS